MTFNAIYSTMLRSVDESLADRLSFIGFLKVAGIPFTEDPETLHENYVLLEDRWRGAINAYTEFRLEATAAEEKLLADIRGGVYFTQDTSPEPPKLPVDGPARKFADRQIFRLEEKYQGRGKVHPYGDRYWYVRSAEFRNGRWVYNCKLSMKHNSDVLVEELARKEAFCDEYEMVRYNNPEFAEVESEEN